MSQLALEFGVGSSADTAQPAPSGIMLLERFLSRHYGETAPAEARRLIDAYGDLGGVSAAATDFPPSILGVSEPAAADLALLRPIALEMARDQLVGRNLLSSFSAVLAFLKTASQHDTIESFRVLYLDRKNSLIKDEVMGRGTVDHAPVYPREVARRAIILGASALILSHNHPSGDPEPSQADITMTKTLIDILRPLEINVHDHIIVARTGHASLKMLALI